MIAVGSNVGPYEVVADLGSGGMAHLFLAVRDGPAGFRREVAIKAIKPAYTSDKSFVDMFLDEGRIAARIQHPNVVRIEELGESGGAYYLVMEYVHGATLAKLLTGLYGMGRTLEPVAAAAIAMRVAAGLHAAHETRGDDGALLQVVHRDVSPQNLIVATSGSVKLIDFGIAKAKHRLHRTGLGQMKGKLRYMAPEQMRGDVVDRRADIWSLGVVLWEALATRRLYGSVGDLEVVRLALSGELSPPGAHCDVPFALDRVVMQCLSVDPSARPATAHTLRESIREALPDAGRVDDPQLAALLFGVLGPELDAKAAELPINTPTQRTLPPRPAPQEVLAELTRWLDDDSDATTVGTYEGYQESEEEEASPSLEELMRQYADRDAAPASTASHPASPQPASPLLAPPPSAPAHVAQAAHARHAPARAGIPMWLTVLGFLLMMAAAAAIGYFATRYF